MSIGIFRRKAALRFDEHLTYFTTEEAAEFRAVVSRSFAAAGREVTVYVDRAEDHGGTTFSLWNIGALCKGHDRGEWPGIVLDHARRVTTPVKDLADLTDDELTRNLYLRVVEEASVPDRGALGYARVVAPGLLEVLSVDLPETVATPSEAELTAIDALDSLMELGRGNLRALLRSPSLAAETIHEHAGRFIAVVGESYFTASLALLLPDVLERFGGERAPGRGVLLAVPNRHTLLYRPVDGKDAALALHQMFEMARRGFAEQAGPLSPEVYWVRNHRWVPVTSTAGGRPKVHLGSGLRDAFRAH